MRKPTDAGTSAMDAGIAGPDHIAIVGYSFKLPQDVDDDSSFWELLLKRRNLMTEWPQSRINAQSFTDSTNTKVGFEEDVKVP